MNSEEVKKLIEKGSDTIQGKIIFDAIEDHKVQHLKMKAFYERYKGEVPIKTRNNLDKSGISLNNKIATDYDGMIIDEIKGYLWGNPIAITYDDEQNKQAIQELINNFKLINNMDSMDEESGEYSCICGYGARLCYYDTDGILKVMNLKPWQTYFIYNNSTDQLEYAMVYYPWDIVDVTTGKVNSTIKVEWYDKTEVSYWIKSGGRFEREDLSKENAEYKNPQPHNFDFVPVIKVKGNSLEQSNLEKPQSLIDGYNELLSDGQNELQEFVHAYLVATGAEITQEERIKARQSRVFNLPDKDADIKFIIKEIADAFFESQKKTLDENIFKSSRTVNMNDEKFTAGGAESGEARKWRLTPLEFLAISKERKFTEALREMYKVLGTAWNKKSLGFDYLKLKFQYKRALPVDYLYYAQVANQLKGTFPILDILKLLPFVDDPQAVYERLQEEQSVNLDTLFPPAALSPEDQAKAILAGK